MPICCGMEGEQGRQGGATWQQGLRAEAKAAVAKEAAQVAAIEEPLQAPPAAEAPSHREPSTLFPSCSCCTLNLLHEGGQDSLFLMPQKKSYPICYIPLSSCSLCMYLLLDGTSSHVLRTSQNAKNNEREYGQLCTKPDSEKKKSKWKRKSWRDTMDRSI